MQLIPKHVAILAIANSIPTWMYKELFTTVAQISMALSAKDQDSCLACINVLITFLSGII